MPEVVGNRRKIVVAMDWTAFDADGPATLALHLVTVHGRATPLVWLTMLKGALAGQRNAIEDACLVRLAEVLPAGTRVPLLADRGFGDHTLFAFLTELGFDYVIRLRGNIPCDRRRWRKAPGGRGGRRGRPRPQAARGRGRARKLHGAALTATPSPVGAVVCVQAKGMKEPCCLAASMAEAPTREIVHLYAKRWTIEPTFRETKDLRFGMGLSAVRIGDPERRDRLTACSCSTPLPSYS